MTMPANLPQTSTGAEQVVLDFLALWAEPDGLVRSVQDYFTPATVYENIGMSRTCGIDEACAFFTHFAGGAGCTAMAVQTLSIASDAQGRVLTERIDDVLGSDGQVLLSLAVMGIFEIAEGKILAWRDYFDTAALPRYTGPGELR